MPEQVPQRVCVVCREAHARTELIRLVRRPTGRIGWPVQGSVSVGKRATPAGKGLYVCSGDKCLGRLLTEKRFRRMFVESMEEECVARLSALLPRPVSSSGGAAPRASGPRGASHPKEKIEDRNGSE